MSKRIEFTFLLNVASHGVQRVKSRPKVRNRIWVRTLNVLNLKYERLVHNSAKVVPLQVFLQIQAAAAVVL